MLNRISRTLFLNEQSFLLRADRRCLRHFQNAGFRSPRHVSTVRSYGLVKYSYACGASNASNPTVQTSPDGTRNTRKPCAVTSWCNVRVFSPTRSMCGPRESSAFNDGPVRGPRGHARRRRVRSIPRARRTPWLFCAPEATSVDERVSPRVRITRPETAETQ